MNRPSGRLARLRSATMAAAVAATVFLLPRTSLAEDQNKLLLFMDNSVTGLIGSGFEVDDNDHFTITLEHASGWSFGDLFAFWDYTSFNADLYGASGTDWYGEITPRFSIGKLSGTDLSFSMLGHDLIVFKDALIAVSYERGRNEDVTESILLGIGFDLDMSAIGVFGNEFRYFQINFFARNELNCCAGSGPDENGFKDMQITVSASYPFDIERAKFLIDGYLDYIAGFGPQNSNLHINPQIKLDVGNFWGRPEVLYVGVELDYWSNKFGLRNTSTFDTNQFAVSGLVKFHF